MQLNENEIHLLITDLNGIDRDLIPDYQLLMTDEELVRNQRFHFEEGRIANCVTRALVRSVLSHYTAIDPRAWQFSKGEHGKPEINKPALHLPLRFNLSHSSRYVVCAVGLSNDLGVDIECTERKNALTNIADRYFSPVEVEDFFALPESCQKSRFFDYWTLKEAYMKARGEGISLGLGNFSFRFPSHGEIQVSFNELLDDKPEDWRFWLFSPSPDHRMAVALRSEQQQEITLRLFETEPLMKSITERDIDRCN